MAARDGTARRSRSTILVMILLSITVLTLDAKDVPVLGSIRSGALSALSPVESAFSSVTRPLRSAWRGIGGYDELEAENRRLRAELDKYRGAAERNDDLAEQVRKLREQLGVPFVEGYRTVVAQVATGNFSSFDDSTLQLDRGSEAGIRVGNPVVTNAGVVGRVTRVARNRTVVQLITDPDFSLGVRLKSNDLGVGRGAGPDRPFIVDRGIDLTDPVAVGDPVSTSGTARAIMPRDLPIGTVTKVTRNQAEQTQVLQVKLSADLTRLDFVQVLDWVPES
jgi:rod shape-determining protein MreC